jgi:hypothetical protein
VKKAVKSLKFQHLDLKAEYTDILLDDEKVPSKKALFNFKLHAISA